MNDVNVVMFINAMFSGCSDEEKQKLTSLYQSAFSGTEYYKKMHQILNDCEFYGAVGRELSNRGSNAIKVGMTDATQFSACIDNMEYVITNAEKALAETEEYISHYRCDIKNLSVIEKSRSELLKRFYGYLINVICYTVTCLYGSKFLVGLKVDPNASSIDIQKNTLSQLVDLISSLKSIEKPKAWKIVRKRFYGANFVKYDGFDVEYINSHNFNKENYQIAPYLFGSSNSNILCSGAGNITNLMPSNGMSVLNSDIVVKLPLNSFDDIENVMEYQSVGIIDIINILSKDKMICVPPEDIVDLLNRYFVIKTVKERETKNVCVYCGATNCDHFGFERKFEDSLIDASIQ